MNVELEKERLAELQKRPPDPTKRARKFGALDVKAAVERYAEDRGSQVSARMVAWWKEMGVPLAAFFGEKPLRRISPADLLDYQNTRMDLGRAPKTINSELSVLRQLLKHAKLWYRFADEYKPLKNTKPPAGQALTDEDQTRLFQIAKSKPACTYGERRWTKPPKRWTPILRQRCHQRRNRPNPLFTTRELRHM